MIIDFNYLIKLFYKQFHELLMVKMIFSYINVYQGEGCTKSNQKIGTLYKLF
jgi:hypothetical protein